MGLAKPLTVDHNYIFANANATVSPSVSTLYWWYLILPSHDKGVGAHEIQTRRTEVSKE